MSKRFSGWDKKTVALLGLNDVKVSKPKKNKVMQPDYPEKIKNALKVFGIEAVKEYKFHPERKFKFDLAIPEHRVAIEFEGGIFTQGRHVNGDAYAKDCFKYNLAIITGKWFVFRYNTLTTKKKNWHLLVANEIAEFIKTL